MNICEICKTKFKPYRKTQKYCCEECRKKAAKEIKSKWYKKKNPNAYKPKEIKYCCICGDKFAGTINGKDYCNSHWQKVYRYGTPEGGGGSKNTFKVEGDITRVFTRKGEEFVIDTEDMGKISKSTWCKNKAGYPVARANNKLIRLNRFVLDYTGDLVVDHINGDVSDNRKSNLRICTQKENSRNLKICKNNRTGFTGVQKTKTGRYAAKIMVNRRTISLGTFDDINDAIEARKTAEKIYFKEYSRLNSKGE